MPISNKKTCIIFFTYGFAYITLKLSCYKDKVYRDTKHNVNDHKIFQKGSYPILLIFLCILLLLDKYNLF